MSSQNSKCANCLRECKTCFGVCGYICIMVSCTCFDECLLFSRDKLCCCCCPSKEYIINKQKKNEKDSMLPTKQTMN